MKGLSLALWLTLAAPAAAAPAQVLGTIPAYPGATRPLGTLETPERAIALTPDKPEAVVAYYISGLTAAGWTPDPEVPFEADAVKQGQPAWLTFTRAGVGRIDITVASGRHPRTHKPVTVITYMTRIKP